MASNSTLRVIISPNDVGILLKSGYNLCLTKGVTYGGVTQNGNAVFSSVLSKDLGPKITFRWEGLYQVYGVTGLQRRRDVEDGMVETASVDVKAGQDATLTEIGNINITGSSAIGKPFQVHNQWKNPASIGIKMYDSISETFSSIFVTPPVPKPSTNNLLPADSYSVFFDIELVTNAIIKNGTSTPPFWFNFSNQTEVTLSYIDGNWTLGG